VIRVVTTASRVTEIGVEVSFVLVEESDRTFGRFLLVKEYSW
jgi:hypothetical protein